MIQKNCRRSFFLTAQKIPTNEWGISSQASLLLLRSLIVAPVGAFEDVAESMLPISIDRLRWPGAILAIPSCGTSKSSALG